MSLRFGVIWQTCQAFDSLVPFCYTLFVGVLMCRISYVTQNHVLYTILIHDSQADKSTIVDEAVSSIKSLEQTLHNLQMRKLEKLQYSSASNTTTTTAFPYDPSSSPTFLLRQI